MTDSNDKNASLRSVSPEDLSEILGLVIHDLRNPLAALSSNVGFLQMVSKEMSEDAREAVDDLLLSVEAMGRIVDSLELVGHDLGGRAGGAPAALSVSSTLRSLKAAAERAAASHNLSFEIDVGELDVVRFQAREQKFVHALSALIHNALTVAPARSTVKVVMQSRGDQVVFRVEDDGPAVTKDIEVQVRTAVAQNTLKSDRKARYSRGLGLFVVARAAELSGARFAVGEAASGSALELLVPRVP